ncbi:MAG: SIMPL domain-containing protein [Ekhidna sp.]
MKTNRSIAIVFLLASMALFGQSNDAKTRTIGVQGSSEIEITPNEIFVGITLKEYKKGGDKVDLDKLESELVSAVKKLKIPEDNLRVQNISGYNWNWKKKRPDDFMGSKSFVLEVSDLKLINNLVGMLDPEGLNNMNVNSYSHSDIESYRKQVKIGAMKAAKEKATYLLESVDEQIGRVLEVQEGGNGYQQQNVSNMAYRSMAMESDYESNVDFKKIKVRAEMRVVFEIKN